MLDQCQDIGRNIGAFRQDIPHLPVIRKGLHYKVLNDCQILHLRICKTDKAAFIIFK